MPKTIDWIPENDQTIIDFVKYRVSVPIFKRNPITIAGPSCAGKTTLANWLVKHLPRSTVIRMDDFYRDGDDPYLPPYGGPYPVFDLPGAYHWQELWITLRNLREGLSTKTPVYDISPNRRTGYKEIVDSDHYILDGLYSFMVGYNTIKIYVDADPAVLFDRRVARDTEHLPHIPLDVIKFMAERVGLAARDLIAPQRAMADLIITANTERW